MLNIGGITFHLYGLLLGLGIYVGWMISTSVNKRYQEEIDKAVLWALTGGVLGARIYHVIDFWQRYYRYNLWKIFAVWEGGLGIWGAIAGAVIATLFYCRLKKKNAWLLLDAFSIGAPAAQAIGRLGNFVNGEIVGKNGEPLFAYEALLNLILLLILWRQSKKKHLSGKIFGCYLMGYGIIRVLLENLRPNEIVWKIAGVPTAMIFGAVSIFAGLIILTYRKRS